MIVDGAVEWEVEGIIGKYVDQVTKKEQQQVVQSSRPGLRPRKQWRSV